MYEFFKKTLTQIDMDFRNGFDPMSFGRIHIIDVMQLSCFYLFETNIIKLEKIKHCHEIKSD